MLAIYHNQLTEQWQSLQELAQSEGCVRSIAVCHTHPVPSPPGRPLCRQAPAWDTYGPTRAPAPVAPLYSPVRPQPNRPSLACIHTVCVYCVAAHTVHNSKTYSTPMHSALNTHQSGNTIHTAQHTAATAQHNPCVSTPPAGAHSGRPLSKSLCAINEGAVTR